MTSPGNSRLLEGQSPLAIFTRITLAIVDAFDTVIICWSAAHIVEKILERLPSFAIVNSATTIALHRRIAASMLNARPYSVFGQMSKAMGALPTPFVKQASARSIIFVCQSFASNDSNGSAIASAIPRRKSRLIFRIARIGNNDQSIKPLTLDISKCFMLRFSDWYNLNAHFDTSYIKVGSEGAVRAAPLRIIA